MFGFRCFAEQNRINYFAKCFIDKAVKDGIDYETAKALCVQGIIGSAKMIEASDKSDYDLKVTFFKPMYGTNYDVAYGKVNSDGTVITFDGFTSNFFGPCSSFTINVDGTNLSGNYAGSLAYTAVKK